MVLASELERAVVILRVEAQASLGQRHAELVFVAVFEFAQHPDFFVRRYAIFAFAAEEIPCAVIHRRAVINEDFRRLHAAATNELDLLGFLIAQGQRTGDGVEVEFIEGFFGDGLRHRIGLHGHRFHAGHRRLRLQLVHIARHQLDLCLFESCTALVFECHPADDVDHVALVSSDDVVVRLPAESSSDIGNLGIESRSFRGVDRPCEGWVEDRIIAERGKERLAG